VIDAPTNGHSDAMNDAGVGGAELPRSPLVVSDSPESPKREAGGEGPPRAAATSQAVTMGPQAAPNPVTRGPQAAPYPGSLREPRSEGAAGRPALRISKEDRARLSDIVSDHFDFIWRSLRRLGVPGPDADDCAQQVFWVAARKLTSISEGSERAFLFSTALRVASDARRSRGRRREVAEDEATQPCDPGPRPDEAADQKRARELLDEVLGAMPMELRAVFVLFELEEMSTPEIAGLLEIPTGTVASRLRRSREEFQRIVGRLKARAGGRR
jgi:RNA polymerase sigma-70 factor, ECF subfamily